MTPEIHKIPLTPHQAAAILTDINEINHEGQLVAAYEEALNARKLALSARAVVNKRYTDAIVADAGLDPATFASYRVAGGFMELTPAPAALVKE